MSNVENVDIKGRPNSTGDTKEKEKHLYLSPNYLQVYTEAVNTIPLANLESQTGGHFCTRLCYWII